METTTAFRIGTTAAGALLLTGLAAAPALAEEYPPNDPATDPAEVDPGGNGADTGQQARPAAVTVPTDGETPAYTGAATTLALAVGVIALGAGAGLLIASRRRQG